MIEYRIHLMSVSFFFRDLQKLHELIPDNFQIFRNDIYFRSDKPKEVLTGMVNEVFSDVDFELHKSFEPITNSEGKQDVSSNP